VFLFTLTGDRAAAAAGIAQAMQVSVDEVLRTPIVVMGTEQEVVDQLERQRETYGVSYLTATSPAMMRELAPVVARLAGA
jgi:hypothetical protein